MTTSSMKTSRILTLILTFFAFLAPAAEPWEADFGKLLAKHVTPAGRVKYSAWKASAEDMAALTKVTDAIAAAGPTDGSKDGRMAYYINAYNAWVLRGVLEKYPIASVRDIAPLFGFFTQERITVGGKKMSLNALEKQILIKEFRDPRVHFAINCASASCPPLLSTPYSAARLNGALDLSAKKFVNSNPLAVQIAGKEAKVSMIFDWYADDFKAAGGAAAYINSLRAEPLPAGAKIKFQEYDWSLNDAK